MTTDVSAITEQVELALRRVTDLCGSPIADIRVSEISAITPISAPESDFVRGTFNGATILCHPTSRSLGRRNALKANGKNAFICLGAEVTISECRFDLHGPGSGLIVAPGCRLNNLFVKVWGKDALVYIGPETSWESGTILCDHGRIVAIGHDCMVSNQVVVRTSDGHGIFDADSGSRINPSGDVVIENHVWLGNSSRVNKGTRIGQGTVLGQMSIASGRLDPASVYAGAPARKLRERVVWSRTESIEHVPGDYRLVPEPVSAARGQLRRHFPFLRR
jgi:carbonic anhydrase/acetyltransferase-like protein (isoleucine patch superfamily)